MIEIGLIVLLGATVQSAVGFAYSLITMPLFLQAGLNLPQAVAMSFVTSTAQRIFFMAKKRSDIEWSALRVPIVFCLLALPVGIFLLGMVSTESKTVVKQMVGALVLLTVLLKTAVRMKPKPAVGMVWGIVAGICSGVLNGLANIGGPPIILWVYTHDWRKERLHSASIAISMPIIPFQAVLLLWKFGGEVLPTMLTGLCFTPVALLGIFLGLWISSKVNVAVLRGVVTALLIIIGVVYLLQPYI
ncbi:MAG: sulfite exporter TauE/SafE family protein [Kiritimatiellaeota bacterium]|nr:sulfite exporter TauE/SafE family protein [Kiritimatiellota bacterium]